MQVALNVFITNGYVDGLMYEANMMRIRRRAFGYRQPMA